MTEQVALAASVAPQLVVLVKSPERTSESAKAVFPVLPMVSDCVPLDVLVTTTAVAKLIELVERLRLGLTLAPLAAGCGCERPVTSAVSPLSSCSVSASAEGVFAFWYASCNWQTVLGSSVAGQRSVTVKGEVAGSATAVCAIAVVELFER